jgi:hypothetical protein
MGPSLLVGPDGRAVSTGADYPDQLYVIVDAGQAVKLCATRQQVQEELQSRERERVRVFLVPTPRML